MLPLLPIKTLKNMTLWLLRSHTLKKVEGAEFSKARDYKKYLNSSNTGILFDGKNMRLSERDSFQNACIIARIGAGKTSRYIIPNVFYRATKKCSMVINDPKGEVYAATSAYLKKMGYKLRVISPNEPEFSSHFNSLSETKNDIELEQVAEIIIRAGNPSLSMDDNFWNQGAIRFVSLFLRCLKNANHHEPGVFNLVNLYRLFQKFGDDGSELDRWMAKNTINPEDPNDPTLWDEWEGLLVGNEQGILSFVLTAITALKALSNKGVAQVTSKSDFSLSKIRDEKTAIFFITPPQLGEYYGFITSLFFRSVFNASMRRMPDKHTLPLYVFYDEFGHSTIPQFVSTANTIRAYKVSLSIVLQSISQLSNRYGRDTAHAIQGGFAHYITYAGSDPETTSFFEGLGGVRRITQLPLDHKHGNEQYTEKNLINAGEVRTLSEDEIILISFNKQPIKLKTKGYFQQGRLKYLSNQKPAPLPHRGSEPIRYTKIEPIRNEADR